jgi:SAM-dependent methyltransferase
MAEERKDVWAAGDLYEPYVGRWSRLVAEELLDWLQVPEGKAWLDVGCGTGALTESILRHSRPSSVIGLDPSPAFVAYARDHVQASVASFEVGDAQSLPAGSAEFDVALSGLVLNFIPTPERAVAEMARVVRHGGTVAAYVWDYSGKMELIRYFWNAAVALDPAALELDEGRRFPICHPGPLASLFTEAGLRAVEVRPIDVPTRFRDFDDYWSPFLGGQAPAPGYAMSLSDDKRDALRDRIRASLPISQNGTIDITARAWAVRGNR